VAQPVNQPAEQTSTAAAATVAMKTASLREQVITETVPQKAPQEKAKIAAPMSPELKAKAETIITMLSKPRKTEAAVQMIINSKNEKEVQAVVQLIESNPEQKSELMTKLIQGVVTEANQASNAKSLTMTQKSLDTLALIKNVSANPENVKKTAEIVANNIGVNPEVAAKIDQTMKAENIEITQTARSISMAAKPEDVMLKDISAELKAELDKAEMEQGRELTTEEKMEVVTKHIIAKTEKVIEQIKSAKPEEVKQEMEAIKKDMQVLAKLVKQARPADTNLAKEVDSIVKKYEIMAQKPITAKAAEEAITDFKKAIEAANKEQPNKVLAAAAQNLEEAGVIIKKRESAEKSVDIAKKLLVLLKRENPDIPLIIDSLDRNNPAEVLSVLKLMVADGQIEDNEVLSSLNTIAEKFSVSDAGKAQVQKNAEQLTVALAKAAGQPQKQITQPAAQAQETIKNIENKFAAVETVAELDAIKANMVGLETDITSSASSTEDSGMIPQYLLAENYQTPDQIIAKILFPTWETIMEDEYYSSLGSGFNYKPHEPRKQEEWVQLYDNTEFFGEKIDILTAQMIKMTETLYKMQEERIEQGPVVDKKTLESQQVKDIATPVVETKVVRAAAGDVAGVDTMGLEQQFENKFGRPPGKLEILSMKVRAAAENVRDASAEMNKDEMLKNVKLLRKKEYSFAAEPSGQQEGLGKCQADSRDSRYAQIG
ncbi:MAG: hypothetical protein ABIH39_04345, partial [Candidatus Margulisiibacteriota bacterium]